MIQLAGRLTAEKFVTVMPISDEVLADTGVGIGPYVQRGMLRALTADLFGERWSSAEAEMERLEHRGQVLIWDSFDWDDEEDEW